MEDNFTIKGVLKKARNELVSSPTACLDAEVLLAHVLKKRRSYLYTWPEKKLKEKEILLFKDLIERRKKGEPVAYLTGHKEFWSLDLLVTKDTLIPRPETELLIEVALNLFPESKKLLIADLGTGSGAIALALAHERPNFDIIATDCSKAALDIAKKNAKRLAFKNIKFFLTDWCLGLPQYKFDAIISNPPYVAKKDFTKDLDFELREALISEDAGLESIKKIIFQSTSYLKRGGFLLLEHGSMQGSEIRKIFLKNKYKNITTKKDLANLERVTYAQFI